MHWKHVRAVLLLPFTVAVLVPAALVLLAGGPSPYLALPPYARFSLMIAGGLFVLLGLGLVAITVRLFAREGEGTLAPWDPPQNLVVQGSYRYVRNPMISGVLAILAGEALALGSLSLLVWFLLFFAVNAVYIPLHEERALEERFGREYRTYRAHVPRWIPRHRPWVPEETS